ncbi:hypothetical protein Tco_0550488 [Tanacetum coccineum]
MADATDSPTSLANRAIALVKMAKQNCFSNSSSISHLSKDMHERTFSMKDMRLVGDIRDTEAEKNFMHASLVGIIKCVGRFDTKKFQSSLYETEYKQLLHESHKEIIEEFYRDSILSMHTSFDCFKNLESISLTLPCFQHDMNESMGYFWKLFRMESFFFMGGWIYVNDLNALGRHYAHGKHEEETLHAKELPEISHAFIHIMLETWER